MQRYFVSKEQFHENNVQITGDDVHHLVKVMRAQLGDQVICSDGINREALVEITGIEKSLVLATTIKELTMLNEPKVNVWVAQSLPKLDKLETVIQKCTEVGAVRFIPFVSERTIVQYDQKKEAKRHDRWCKIAKEAAEQAHRNRIPIVDSPLSWKELLKLVPEQQLAVICYEKEDGSFLENALKRYKSKVNHDLTNILIVVGPEGGFSPKEIEQAEAAGCVSISLGRRILRTETAAMVALTCILYELGEMGE